MEPMGSSVGSCLGEYMIISYLDTWGIDCAHVDGFRFQSQYHGCASQGFTCTRTRRFDSKTGRGIGFWGSGP